MNAIKLYENKKRWNFNSTLKNCYEKVTSDFSWRKYGDEAMTARYVKMISLVLFDPDNFIRSSAQYPNCYRSCSIDSEHKNFA